MSTPTHTNVTPSDCSGWKQWSATLLSQVQRLGHQRVHSVLIAQPTRTQRRIEIVVGPGFGHALASSNAFLTGASRLSGVDERLLTLLGWVEPTLNRGEYDGLPSDWRLPLVRGDWASLVETVAATIVGVFGFSEQLPVEISVVPVERFATAV